ncbi:MAG: GNAT family N-acetyltransferase [Candidatus Bathyarchaeota archaeon]|nr:MAG: GNAT family N-acetyltransferase [Candidatus Bathyarchaeota archaeon]
MFEFGRIRFRPVEREDLKILHSWENDFELIMYSRSKPMNFVNMAQLEKQYEEWIKDERELRFIVELADSKEPIGIARLRRGEWANVKTAEVGTYIGKKELWGKGLGKQITVALLEMAFNQLNMDRCEAWSVEYNQRAHKSLETCGFKRGGIMRDAAFINGRKWGAYHFDILRDEYLSLRDDLLKQALGDKLDEYLKKHCTIEGY